MKKHLKSIGIAVLSTLTIITIFFAVKASNEGSNLLQLEKQADELTQQNRELKDKIVNVSSLSQVSKMASSLGLDKPEKFVYISRQGIALR
ncbi:hypothetical protein BH10PAT1_BH10PAT1_4500 [soil metagenome]